jgi:hypothetical protein
VGLNHFSNLLVPKSISSINENVCFTCWDDRSIKLYDLKFHDEIVIYNKIFYKFITSGNHHGYYTCT